MSSAADAINSFDDATKVRRCHEVFCALNAEILHDPTARAGHISRAGAEQGPTSVRLWNDTVGNSVANVFPDLLSSQIVHQRVS
jgi:hypothetical protein